MSGIRIKAKAKQGVAEVKVLAKHPMDTGMAKDKAGKTIPARYIESLTARVGGEVVFDGHLGPAVSKNPYVKFYYAGQAGDVITLHWIDSTGQEEKKEATVK
jgi:sulfur-oxidizing protein SoxZ